MTGSSYRGRLHVAGTHDTVDAVFRIVADELVIEVAATEVGRWRTDDLTVELRYDGLHVDAGLDHLVLILPDAEHLAEALDPALGGGRGLGEGVRRGWERLRSTDVRWLLASVAVVGTLFVAYFATSVLGAILTLAGMLGLVLAGLVASDDPDAYRFLPNRLDERALFLGGLGLVAVGLLLVSLG
ncbi:MAG TPA: hypothetical protein ENK55_11645 [Actinobacteria bacterium]|nr:hypothetical protein [Actinomycetota bacterium]